MLEYPEKLRLFLILNIFIVKMVKFYNQHIFWKTFYPIHPQPEQKDEERIFVMARDHVTHANILHFWDFTLTYLLLQFMINDNMIV